MSDVSGGAATTTAVFWERIGVCRSTRRSWGRVLTNGPIGRCDKIPNVDTLPQEIFTQVRAKYESKRVTTTPEWRTMRGHELMGDHAHFSFAPSRATVSELRRPC